MRRPEPRYKLGQTAKAKTVNGAVYDGIIIGLAPVMHGGWSSDPDAVWEYWIEEPDGTTSCGPEGMMLSARN